MKKVNFISLNDFLIKKTKKENLKKEKEKKDSLVEYQRLFNQGKITSENNKNNKYIFLKFEGALSKFRKNWLIRVEDISEVAQHSEISKIGYTNNYIVGISNFKGKVCTIIDMSMLLNNKKSTIPSNSCVLLRENDGIALLWTKVEISELELNKVDIEELKNENFFERVHYVKEYHKDINGNIWNELDITQLLHSKKIVDGANINDFL